MSNKPLLSVIANINIEIQTPFYTAKKAYKYANNYKLPNIYIKDSFKLKKIIESNSKKEIEHYNLY